MEALENIKDYIDDAFDVWPELECGLDGLLGYVGEYNECFNTGKENVDWAEHIILFSHTALKRGHDLPLEIKEECRRAVKYLEREKVSVLETEIQFLRKKGI